MRHRLLAAALALALSSPLAAQSAAAPTVVIVVRHAEKGTEPAPDPPLTPAGEARARALVDALADAHVDAILSTPLLRNRSTAAPLAAKLGLTPEIVPVTGGASAHAEAVAASIREKHRGQTVLVVEHSNTAPAVIKALGGPAMRDLCDQQYASLFVLVLDGATARMVRSSYGAEDAAEAGSCNGMR